MCMQCVYRKNNMIKKIVKNDGSINLTSDQRVKGLPVLNKKFVDKKIWNNDNT